jgi:hypothetical protein
LPDHALHRVKNKISHTNRNKKKEHVKFALDEIKKNKTITIEVLLSKLKDKFKDL